MEYYENFKHYRVLGSGSFGCVTLLQHRRLNTIIACKSIDKHNLKSWRNEVSMLKLLKHPNIIKLYDFLILHQKYYIYMEHLDMDLNHYIYNYLAIHAFMSEHRIAKVAVAIAKALDYCHSQSIIHCDVKPSNIVLSENFEHIKLIDFGISRNTQSHEYSSKIGTANYRSPELLFNMKYGTDVDVWSMGCVIAEMFMKKQIFGGHCYYYDNEPKPIRNLKTQIFNIITRLGFPDVHDGEIYTHIFYHTFKNKKLFAIKKTLIPIYYEISTIHKYLIHNIFKWKRESRLKLKDIINHFYSNSLLVRLDSTNL